MSILLSNILPAEVLAKAAESLPIQTNQTLGVSLFGNTNNTSSATYDARSVNIVGAGNITIGNSAGSIVISGTNATVAAAPVNFSAGTTSGNLSSVVFSNANGVSFGLNGSTITASAIGGAGGVAISAGTNSTTTGVVQFVNANGVSFGMNTTGVVTGSVASQTNQTIGLFAAGNTTGTSNSTYDARSLSIVGAGNVTIGNSNGSLIVSASSPVLSAGVSGGNTSGNTGTVANQFVLAGGNNITLSGSTNAGGMSITISGGTVAGVPVNFSAGTTSGNLGSVVFSNANGVSFGLNGSTLTGSIPAQTVQTQASGNIGATGFATTTTAGLVIAGTHNTTGFTLAVPPYLTTQTVQTGISGIQVSNTTFTSGTVNWQNANGISFGSSGVNGVSASYTVPTQVSLFAAGNTTQNSSTVLPFNALSFNGLGEATVGFSNGSIQISAPPSAIGVSAIGNTAGNTGIFNGQVVFAGGNNVTLSVSSGAAGAQTITISGANAAAGSVNVSAGTTSGNLGSVVFSNSNGVSFGLNGSTITGSAAAQTNQTLGVFAAGNTTGTSNSTYDARSLSIVGAGIITVGNSAGSIIISAPGTTAITLLSAGVSGGNTSGNTGTVSNQLVLAGGNNITLSGSTNAGGMSVTISGAAAGGAPNFSAGTTSGNLGSVVFSNSNGVSFGLNGSTITGSVAAQTIGVIAGSNTTGTTSSTYDARSLNIIGAGIVSVGNSAGSIIISAPGTTAVTLLSAGVSTGGNTAGNTGTVSNQFILAGGSNITLSGSTNATGMTVSVIGGAGGGGGGVNFGVSTGGNTAGATGTVSTGNVVLVGSGPISLSQATGGAGSNATITINGPAISTISGTGAVSVSVNGSTISIGVPSVSIGVSGGNTSNASGTVSNQFVLAGGNNITLSGSTNAGGMTVTISGGTVAGAPVNFSAGTTSGNLGSVVFSNSNGVSFGLNGSTITASAVGGGGAAQSIGVSNVGNTAGNTGTFSGQVVFAGGNNITLSVSSGAAGAQTITIVGNVETGVGLSAAGQSITSGVVTMSNSNNVSFGMAGSVITGSASFSQSNQNMSLFGLGNTTQNSSTVLNANALSFNGLGAMTVGFSNGSAQLSVPATSSLSATGIASVSVNGNTISIGAAIPQLSFFQPLGPVLNTTVTQNGLGSVQIYPAAHIYPFTASRVDMMASVSAAALAASTEAQTLSMYVGLYSLNGSTLSLASSGSQSYAWTNNSGGSSSVITGLRRFSAPINVNYTGGFELFVAVMSNTTFANTNGISLSNVVVPLGPGPQLQGLIGQVAANSMQFVPGQGFFSATSVSMPSSMALSQISGAGSGGSAVVNYAPVQFVNITA